MPQHPSARSQLADELLALAASVELQLPPFFMVTLFMGETRRDALRICYVRAISNVEAAWVSERIAPDSLASLVEDAPVPLPPCRVAEANGVLFLEPLPEPRVRR